MTVFFQSKVRIMSDTLELVICLSYANRDKAGNMLTPDLHRSGTRLQPKRVSRVHDQLTTLVVE